MYRERKAVYGWLRITWGKKLDEGRVRKQQQTYSGHNKGKKGMMRQIFEHGRPSVVVENHVYLRKVQT